MMLIINQKKRKNILFSIVCITIGLIGLFNGIKSLSTPEVPDIEKFNVYGTYMSVEYDEYIGYTAVVTGKAQNLTDNKFVYVQIQFSIYDEMGNNIGSAFANMNQLAAKEIWSFSANLYYATSRPVSFKLSNITCW